MVIQGSERKDIDEVYAGDIAALVGLRNITTGDTLCDEDFDITLEPPTFPEPVISHGHRAEDQGRPRQDVRRPAAPVPKKIRPSACFTNEETGQLIIAGMGELHLEIIRDRLKREFKVEADAGAPQIAYRETITKRGRRRRQVHPPVRRSRSVRPRRASRSSPTKRARASRSSTRSSAARFPKEYIPAVNDGIREKRSRRGVVRRLSRSSTSRSRSRTASFHEVDSNELAFKMAGIFALKDAFEKAGSDPARADHEGRGHHARRVSGRPARRHQPPPRQSSTAWMRKDGQTILNAQVPLAEMFGYADRHPLAVEGPRAPTAWSRCTSQQVPNSVLTAVLDAAKKKPAARS
jgi:elongation factor G